MTKASDNAFPSILITEGTEPSAPAAGKQRVYIDSTSHKLSRTDSSGTEVNLESITEAKLTLADNTTANASTSQHGFLKKLDNSAAHFMDGQGNWSTPSGTGALTLLDTQTVTGSDATITFSSISGSYNDLIIVGRVRDDAAAVVTASPEMRVGHTTVDSGSNYIYSTVEWRTGNADAFSDSGGAAQFVYARSVVGASATAGLYSPIHIEIIDYADSSVFRLIVSGPSGSVNATDRRTMIGEGYWANTSSTIDIITIAGPSMGNLKVGSKLRLYGRL